MDLVKATGAVAEFGVENAQELTQHDTGSVEDFVSELSAPASSDEQMAPMPLDCNATTSGEHLKLSDETPEELANRSSLSGLRSGHGEDDSVTEQSSEVLVDLAPVGQQTRSQLTTAEVNNDNSCRLERSEEAMRQLSTTMHVMEDSHPPVLSDTQHRLVKDELEDRVDGDVGVAKESHAVEGSGEDSQQLRVYELPGTNSQSHLSIELLGTCSQSESIAELLGICSQSELSADLPSSHSQSQLSGCELVGSHSQSQLSIGQLGSHSQSELSMEQLGSRSQSPLSYVIQLNEDSECSLQSLPSGECGLTNFSVQLGSIDSNNILGPSEYLGTGLGPHAGIRATAMEYLMEEGESSRCSSSERLMNDETDLLMEVETGSSMSEALVISEPLVISEAVSIKETTKIKSGGGRSEDRNNSRIRRRLMGDAVPLDTGDGKEEATATQVFEYQWPPNDRSAEWFLLQEHISEFLGVVSFKRKYPDIYRRAVGIHERQFLQDSKVVTEMQCDLGLTVLKADEVYDIMERDYPDKFKEYSSIIHKRQQQQKTEKAAEAPTEKSKLETLVAKSVKSAADFNASLMRELRHERRAYFDLQTSELHYPRGQMRVCPPEATKIGRYPLAVLPGQFQHYYRRYTPAELRRLPINTVMSDNQPQQPDTETPQDADNEQNEVQRKQKDENETSATDVTTDNDDPDNKDSAELQTESTAASVVTVSSGVQVDQQSASATDATPAEADADAVTIEDAQPFPATVVAAAPKVKRRKQAVADEDSEVAVAEKKKVIICVSCGGSNRNRLDEPEDMICCAVCSSSGHPSCLDLTAEMIPIIRSYAWQCMDCKTCARCMNPHDEDQMMFCDHCDRGYHTFCVGLCVIPAGRWECPSCNPDFVAAPPPKPKRGRPFKYPRRAAFIQVPKPIVSAEPTVTAEQQ